MPSTPSWSGPWSRGLSALEAGSFDEGLTALDEVSLPPFFSWPCRALYDKSKDAQASALISVLLSHRLCVQAVELGGCELELFASRAEVLAVLRNLEGVYTERQQLHEDDPDVRSGALLAPATY
jgi:hypothetical protein